MGWIDIAWPMIGAVSLTLGLIYLLVWVRQPDRYGHLLFFLTALSVSVFSIFELRMMHVADPQVYAATLRWAHVPIAVTFVGIVGFVLLYLRSGRPWLGLAACGLRGAVLVLNFSTGVNVNFVAVTAMQAVPIWGGESIYVPVGIPNPWAIVAQLSNLTLVWFIADASIALWRRGGDDGQRRAAIVGGSKVLCVLIAGALAVLLMVGLVRIPTAVSVCFLGVVIAMAYELGWDVIAAARLAARLRTSEENLRASEQRLQLAAGAGELGLWEWDVGTDVVWMTPECRALFGYQANEPVGLSRFLQTVHSDDRAGVERAVRAAMPKGGHDFERDFRIVRPDGEVRWTRSRGRIERNSMGAAARMRGVSHDITERKRSELEAASRRDEMAHLARVAMLGELSGSLAHELNQPLAAILSNAQAAQRFLMRDPPQLERVSEILADIVKSDKRAGAVITRLRSLLRKEEAHHQPVDMNEVIAEVLALMRSDLLNRRVAVLTELAAPLPAVSGDRVQLQQVLLNLLINGCEAMNGSQPQRELVVRSEVTSSGSVKVSVADRGSGIPPDELERIFEPFVTTKPQGMGLGLAVCRSIVQAHNGRLWAANNPGGGAILCIELAAERTPSTEA